MLNSYENKKEAMKAFDDLKRSELSLFKKYFLKLKTTKQIDNFFDVESL